jgi:hypothetical protein
LMFITISSYHSHAFSYSISWLNLL